MPARKRAREPVEPVEDRAPEDSDREPEDSDREPEDSDRAPDARDSDAPAVRSPRDATRARDSDAPSSSSSSEPRARGTSTPPLGPSACPYLDTIDLANLDFDFEKRCSVSLSPVHVYGCLVCGKYFAGRGKKTHAYAHALECGHHVFMRLADGTAWCLPDGYEVVDNGTTLSRIRDVLAPTYSKKYAEEEIEVPMWRRALDGTEFLVGVVGLNAIWSKRDDGVSAVLQSLNRVAPLRRALLLDENRETEASDNVYRALADITKKIWNARNFKGHSSPHEFMQAVRNRSKDAFGAETGNHDAAQFLRWLLNELIRDEKKRGNSKKSIIQSCFQGEVEIIDDSGAESRSSPFLMLSMDLPNAPLFQDVMEKNIIPQVSLERALLKKFDGVTADPKTQRRFKITKLPNYLIVNYSRFTKNNFFVEKNPTIVTFPTRGLNLADHIPVPKGDENSATYDLIANIVHDGTPDDGSYRAMVYHAPDKNWYETQDLRVAEVLPQQVNLTETYVQIYERRDTR